VRHTWRNRGLPIEGRAHALSRRGAATKLPKLGGRVSLLASAAEHSTVLIGLGDSRGRITYVNPAFLHAVGYSKAELIGKPFSAIISRDPPEAPHEGSSAATVGVDQWQGECVHRRKNGPDVPIMLTVDQIHDAQGRVLGSLLVARSIRERKMTDEAFRRSAERFQQLAEYIREVFFVFTPEPLQQVYLSPAYDEIWGRSRQEVYGRPAAWIDAIHPEDRAHAVGGFARSQRGEATEMEFRITRPDGSLRWINARMFPVHDADGRLSLVVGIAENVTERKRIEQTLRDSLEHARQAHEKLAAALKDSEDRARENAVLTELVDMLQSCSGVEEAYTITGVILQRFFASRAGALCITSPSRNVVEAAAAWGDVPITDQVFGPNDCWALRRGKAHVAESASSPTACRHVHASKPGGYVCVPLSAQGETLGVLCVETVSSPGGPSDAQADATGALVRQATEVGEHISLALANLRLREALRNQSIRDSLTGLFNRRYLEESLERELYRAARSHESVALLVIDIDHFKRFNDALGHQAGDAFLRVVGRFLSERIRGMDLACRYGGEEFVLVLPGASGADARGRADAWREEFKHVTAQHDGQALGGVSLSVGISVFPDHGESGEALIHAADQALYRAKAEGRDRVVVASPA